MSRETSAHARTVCTRHSLPRPAEGLGMRLSEVYTHSSNFFVLHHLDIYAVSYLLDPTRACIDTNYENFSYNTTGHVVNKSFGEKVD